MTVKLPGLLAHQPFRSERIGTAGGVPTDAPEPARLPGVSDFRSQRRVSITSTAMQGSPGMPPTSGAVSQPRMQRRNSTGGDTGISFQACNTPKNSAKAAAILCGFKLFKELDPGVAKRLSEIVSIVSCSNGTVLFRQGDPPGNCYVILSGEVSVFVMPEEQVPETRRRTSIDPTSKSMQVLDFMPGRRTVDGFSHYHENHYFGERVASMSRGQLVGELALLNDQPRSAAIQCSQDCEFLVIGRSDFDKILKEEMVRKGDEKLRFLMEHVPGMRDVAVPKPGAKPHASYFFRTGRYTRGHTFLVQDSVSEGAVFLVSRGSVEFLRSDARSDDAQLCGTYETRSEQIEKLLTSTTGMGWRKQGKSGAMRRAVSGPSLPGVSVDANTAGADVGGSGRVSRRGILVSGGVFGSMPFSKQPEPFTVRVTSATCEVFYVSGSDVAKLPRKLTDTIKEYVASATAWRLRCHKGSQDFRKHVGEVELRNPRPLEVEQIHRSLDELYDDFRKTRLDSFARATVTG